MKSSIAQSKSPGAQENELALFLLLARLAEIRELGLFEGRHLFVGVRLVIEFESVVGVSEVLLGLRFYLRVRLDPVKELRALAIVFRLSRLIIFESLVVVLFFFKRGVVATAKRFCKVISTNESGGIENRSTNHDRDCCHGVYIKARFSNYQTLAGRIFWCSRYRLSAMLPAMKVVNCT